MPEVTFNHLTLESLGIAEMDLSPERAMQTVVEFYQLKVQPTIDSRQAHTERALELGQQMDALFIRDEILPRLAANPGEKIHLIKPMPLRAAAWLDNPNSETNLFKQLERQSKGRFRISYLPMGVTRHKDPSMEIKFHQYFPNGGNPAEAAAQLASMVKRHPGEQEILLGADFGGASGVSMAETMKTALEAFGLAPEQAFINTVIASDQAQAVYSQVIPPGNARRLLTGKINSDAWIIGAGIPGGEIREWQTIDPEMGPKDWGYVCTGMEDPRLFDPTILMTNQEYLELYQREAARFFHVLGKIVQLNSDGLAIQTLNHGGFKTLAKWYEQRLAGHILRPQIA